MSAAFQFGRIARLLLAASLLSAGSSAAVAQTAPRAPAQKPPAAAQPAPKAADGDIVARVGTRDVTAAEVRNHFDGLAPREQAAVAADPTLLAQAIRAYLVDEVVLSAALAKKWEQRPDVAARIERARRAAIMESFLDAASQPPPDYPGEAELQALYDANKTAFMAPRQFQIAQIFVAVPDKAAEDKAKARLDDILARLRQPGADFIAAARIDAAGREAGDRADTLGWVGEPQLKPEIRAEIAGLDKGATSRPIRLADGLHLLKLIDTRPAGARPLAEVRDQLAQRLRQERSSQLRRAAVQELVRQSPAAINELALNRIAPTLGGGAER